MILRSETTSPDAWAVIATPSSVLALPADELGRFDGLGERLAGPDGFRAVLETLVSRGIAAAPSFAVLDASVPGAVSVVLRGAAEVASGPETFSGRGVSTWAERVIEGAGPVRLTVPGSSWTLSTDGVSAPPAVAIPVAPPVASDAPAAEPVAPVAEPDAPVVASAASVAQPVETLAETFADAPVEVTTLAPVRESSAPAPAPALEAETPAEPYDFLFGNTMYRTSSGVSVSIPNPDPERPGDHDGRTVLADELGLAGHAPQAPTSVFAPAAAPTLALQLPDGSLEPITRPILIGRAPSLGSGQVPGPELPRLLTVAVGDKDISRTHARVEVAGGTVVVTDLDSKNGTVITLPGGSPRKLRGGEPAVVLPGTLIDLGGGVTLTVRED